MPHPDDSSTRSWDAAADDWVAHADQNDYRNLYLMPRMLAMLGDVSGLNILDLGCGEGGYSRELARRGAQVVGIDGSARLIEIARERAACANISIEHYCANASTLPDLGPASFDVVLAAMSLMDVEDYTAAIREIHRVLKPGGALFMSITHPCFSTPNSRWVHDAEGTHYAVDTYFDRIAWEELMTQKFRFPVVRRHRPLEDYMRELLDAGFALREFHEPSVTAEELEKSPRRFEHLTRVPYFLFMRWTKP